MASVFYTKEQKEEAPKQPHFVFFADIQYEASRQLFFYFYLSPALKKNTFTIIIFFLGISRHFQAVQHK